MKVDTMHINKEYSLKKIQAYAKKYEYSIEHIGNKKVIGACLVALYRHVTTCAINRVSFVLCKDDIYKCVLITINS